MSKKIVISNEQTMTCTQQYAPLILFVYSRLEHTKRTIEAVKRNKEAIYTDLYVFCDAPNPKSTEKELSEIFATQEYLTTLKEGFAKIKLEISQEHRGAGKAIIRGISMVLAERGMCIILENDMEVSPLFLEYMNKCLVAYKREKKIYGIASTSYNFKIPKWYKKDLYLLTRTESWGWGTWSDRWQNIDWEVNDFDRLRHSKHLQNKFNKGGNDLYHMLKDQVEGKTDTWDLQWAWHVFKQRGFFVYSRYCFQENKGFDGSGRHCGNDNYILNYFSPTYTKGNLDISFTELKPNVIIMNRFRRYHNKNISFTRETTIKDHFVNLLKIGKYLVRQLLNKQYGNI